MNDALITGLVSDDEESIAAFGEKENCVVVDWRDGADEIFGALTPSLPQGYLMIVKKGDTEWEAQAGSRSAKTVEYNQHTKQEDFFVVLNQLFAPDFELRQYTPVDGDGYSLFLAPSAWWQLFAAEHPKVLQKYFLPAERLAAYTRKNYLARLFSKP